MNKIGIFYGSTTGTTEEIVNKISNNLDCDLFNVANGLGEVSNYANLIFATSTWGLGELQDDWAANIGSLSSIDLTGKKVSFVGIGDGSSFADTFVDGIGLIYDEINDADFVGMVSTDEYDYSASLGERDGKFLGLVIDETNEPDKTDDRISAWTEQLKREFE
jgi:flavodoxin I